MAATKKIPSEQRPKILKRAAAAHAKGRHKKSIALYQQLLDSEPDNHELHKKLAPLYVKTRQQPEALRSYRIAAEGLVSRGFKDRAVGLLRGAAAQLPREVFLWESIAVLDVQRGRRVDAVDALLEGRRHMRRRNQRPQAIKLLTRAYDIDPADFRVGYDLAYLLARTKRRARALRLLGDLGARVEGGELVRVRGLQLRLAPGPGALGRYLRALLLRR